MRRFRIATWMLVAVLGCATAATAFAGGAEEGEESSAAAEPAMEMESAGDAVTGFDSYNLDSGKITITSFGEAPMLAARVAEGTLPPVEERLPDNPLVMEPWEEVGSYGGTLQDHQLVSHLGPDHPPRRQRRSGGDAGQSHRPPCQPGRRGGASRGVRGLVDQRRRHHLDVHAAARPEVVGRGTGHHRGCPVLLRGHHGERGTLPQLPGVAGARGSAARVRGGGRSHVPPQLRGALRVAGGDSPYSRQRWRGTDREAGPLPEAIPYATTTTSTRSFRS